MLQKEKWFKEATGLFTTMKTKKATASIHLAPCLYKYVYFLPSGSITCWEPLSHSAALKEKPLCLRLAYLLQIRPRFFGTLSLYSQIKTRMHTHAHINAQALKYPHSKWISQRELNGVITLSYSWGTSKCFQREEGSNYRKMGLLLTVQHKSKFQVPTGSDLNMVTEGDKRIFLCTFPCIQHLT